MLTSSSVAFRTIQLRRPVREIADVRARPASPALEFDGEPGGAFFSFLLSDSATRTAAPSTTPCASSSSRTESQRLSVTIGQ